MLIEKLHLPSKIYELAKEKGISNASEFADRIEELDGFSPYMDRKLQEVGKAINLASVNGTVDETRFLSEMDIPIVPAEATKTSIDEALLCIVEEMMDERSKEILRHRFGLSNTKEKTLDDLGQAYGITRERVRQIEAKSISLLRRLICDSQYTSKEKVHIHPGLSRAICDITSLIKGSSESPIGYDQIKKIISPLVSDEATLGLLIEVAGLKVSKSKYVPPIILAQGDKRADKLSEAIDTIVPIIRDSCEPFSIIDLLIDANKRVKKRGHFTAQIIELALTFIDDVEHLDGHYQCRTESLRRTTDVAYRMIKNEGPKHYGDIVRFVNSTRVDKAVISDRSLTGQLSSDKRFSALGKSGQWALSESKPEVRNIKEVMVEYLNISNKPATPLKFTSMLSQNDQSVEIRSQFI